MDHVPGRRNAVSEWPTWLALAACYTIWFSAVVWHDVLGWWWFLPVIVVTTFHSSLQHEAIHGHPTNCASLNELVVFPALGLFIPYRSFRASHLRHHNNARLTDPYDDPESWYLSVDDWDKAGPLYRVLLIFSRSLGGRMIIGPLLGLRGFWRSEWGQLREGRRQTVDVWLAHAAGLAPVLMVLRSADIPVWQYALLVAYPAMSLLMVRTYIEHRAAEPVPERTAVVEAGLFFRLLFLNNNYHAVHHNHPGVAWYLLPRLWQQERVATLTDNARYHYPGGYTEVARKWLFKPREPVAHPFVRRSPQVVCQLDFSGPGLQASADRSKAFCHPSAGPPAEAEQLLRQEFAREDRPSPAIPQRRSGSARTGRSRRTGSNGQHAARNKRSSPTR
jgi:fatty acid desaturase